MKEGWLVGGWILQSSRSDGMDSSLSLPKLGIQAAGLGASAPWEGRRSAR